MRNFINKKPLWVLVAMDKQDKTVIMAGVIILIISLIGIIYHEKTYVASEEIGKTSFRVTWDEYFDEIVERGEVGRDGWQNSYPIEIGGNAVISSIEVRLTWEDNLDFHGFILPWNWTDKMELGVEIPEMQFSQSASGYEGIEIKASGNAPYDFMMEAKNETEVIKKVKEMVMNETTCKISISITPKPIFFDRGNEFTLHISYKYYMPSIERTK